MKQFWLQVVARLSKTSALDYLRVWEGGVGYKNQAGAFAVVLSAKIK